MLEGRCIRQSVTGERGGGEAAPGHSARLGSVRGEWRGGRGGTLLVMASLGLVWHCGTTGDTFTPYVKNDIFL